MHRVPMFARVGQLWTIGSSPLNNLEKAQYDKELSLQKSQYEAQLSLQRSQYEHQLTLSREMSQYEIKFALEALKAATLVCGGASVALLAFGGQLATRESPSELARVLPAIWFTSTGTCLAAMGFGVAYLSQLAFNAKYEKSYITCRIWYSRDGTDLIS